MSPHTITVYDPPMCCPTGACGPDPDPKLIQLARDLKWFEKKHGVVVERHNLGTEPAQFVSNPTILALLNERDVACLPVVIVDGEVFSTAGYPSRQELVDALDVTNES